MLILTLFLLLMGIKMVFRNNHLFQKLFSRKDLKKKDVANLNNFVIMKLIGFNTL